MAGGPRNALQTIAETGENLVPSFRPSQGVMHGWLGESDDREVTLSTLCCLHHALTDSRGAGRFGDRPRAHWALRPQASRSSSEGFTVRHTSGQFGAGLRDAGCRILKYVTDV
jgi:hypothetical protein